MKTPRLETDRLILREVRAGDVQAICDCWMQDSDVSKYMWWKASDDIAETEGFVEYELSMLDSDTWFRWIIERKEGNGSDFASTTNTVIGTCLIFFNDDEGENHWDISYNLGKKYWGAGYVTEAMRAVMDYAEYELGIREIVTSYATANDASARVLAKLGFVDEATIPFECSGGDIKTEGVLCRWRSGIIAETDRLWITELTLDMAKSIHLNSLDPDNRRFVPDEVFETVEEAEETIKWLMAQYGSFDGPLLYALITKARNASGERDNIGYVQMVPLKSGGWEVGYHIGGNYTGRGYATEAAKVFLPLMAKEIGLQEIYGICLAENAASIRVMEKCGFELDYAGKGTYQGVERDIVRMKWKSIRI